MKKILLMMFAATMVSASILAQEPPPQDPKGKTPEERAENMSSRLSRELALSADQKDKVKAVILKREIALEKANEARKAEMEKVDEEFKKILNSEQYKKFETKKEEIKKKRSEQRMKQGPGNGNPPKDGNPPPPQGGKE